MAADRVTLAERIAEIVAEAERQGREATKAVRRGLKQPRRGRRRG